MGYNLMASLISKWIVIAVGILAVVLPIISRIFSSPFSLLILSPVILSILAVAYFLLYLYSGWYLDSQRTQVPNYLHHAARPFYFSTPAAWEVVKTRSQWSQDTPQTFPPLYPDFPEISDSLNDIISKIIRDFVLNWYSQLSSAPAFPLAVNSIIRFSLEQIVFRASNVDFPSLIVKRILPKVTAHIDQFRESELALRGAGLERRLTQSEELDLLLAGRYASKGGQLHHAIKNLSTTFTRQTEETHIRQLVDKVLPFILPPKEVKSKTLRIAVREIIACSVVYPVIEMVTDPDFWNKTIDQVAGAAIHQQQLISKVRNLLEVQLPRYKSKEPPSVPSVPVSMERITTRTNPRQFESFLRSISRCSSLLDARRLKNDIVGEIRRTRLLLANHEKDDWIEGEKTEDVVAFLDRLYTAKRKVEERIVVLGGGEDVSKHSIQETRPKSRIMLRDILMNPNSLSYFMEFMDRRQRSMSVQFWLTVESFKLPLETVNSDSSGDEEEIIQDPSTLANVKEDIAMIYHLYFANGKTQSTLTSIARKHVDIVRTFVLDPDPSVDSQRRVRRSVLLAQKQVEQNMEQDFEDFERSELWFRAVGDSAFTAIDSSAAPCHKEHDYDRSQSSSYLEHEPRPLSPSQLKSGPVSQVRPSHPGSLAVQRTTSSTSNWSEQSKSFFHIPSNIEVLMSPVPESASAEPTRAPLFDDPEDEMQRNEEKRMEAIHAALTDIISLERQGEQQSRNHSHDRKSSEPTFPTMSSIHLKRKRASLDDILADEDAEREGSPDEHSTFQSPGPGDLQLSYEIDRLGQNITHLEAQHSMLETLINKAELSGDAQELKLLQKSESAMTRELRELQFQKQQYEQQESDNRLVSDRTRVSIVNSTVADESGKQVVRYLIEVLQLAPDGSHASGWVVARRYNEFHNMHNKLKDRYALVKNLEFPGKRLVTSLSGSFLDTRRQALDKYLQAVVAIPMVCESEELRLFLSRDSPFMAEPQQESAVSKVPASFSGTDLVRNVYRSVAESIDDMFFGPSMLDVMIQRLTRQAAEFVGIVGSAVNDEELVAQALNASAPETALMKLSGDLKPMEGESSTSTFISPICDFILAVFELHKQNNWLRRQAIVIILQQVLGGTVERKLRDDIRLLLTPPKLLSYLHILRDNIWPQGKLKPQGIPRTTEEKLRTRDEANRKLSSLVPDLAANMIGRSNARRGARRIFTVLQNRRLNQHIAYIVMDELFAALFPEITDVHNDSNDVHNL